MHASLTRFGPPVFLAAFLAVVGCSRRPSDLPSLFPGEVTVVNRGTAIPGVRVQLVPRKDAPQLAAVAISIVGKTTANGVAILHTNRLGASYQKKGVPANTYLVSIEKTPEWNGAKSAKEIEGMTGEQVMAYSNQLHEAMEKLPREVPKSLSRDNKQPIEILEGKGGSLTIDVAQFPD